MSYIVHYCVKDLSNLTGHQPGDEITEDQVLTMMREAKVNLLIHHVQKSKHRDARDYVYIDDLNHRFQQR